MEATVTDTEFQKYMEFCKDRVVELNCDCDQLPDEQLLGITQVETLFQTQVACLNDAKETLYSNEFFRDALMDIRKGRRLGWTKLYSPERQKLMNELLESF